MNTNKPERILCNLKLNIILLYVILTSFNVIRSTRFRYNTNNNNIIYVTK